MTDCNHCGDRTLVGGFLPLPCPVCRGTAWADNLCTGWREALIAERGFSIAERGRKRVYWWRPNLDGRAAP